MIRALLFLLYIHTLDNWLKRNHYTLFLPKRHYYMVYLNMETFHTDSVTPLLHHHTGGVEVNGKDNILE